MLYETAFDCATSPLPPDVGRAEVALETSRRLCSPSPPAPSPASSRSSGGSSRKSTPAARRGFGSCWGGGSRHDESPSDSPQPHRPPEVATADKAEDKGKTFSPSVEFKKLDVADVALPPSHTPAGDTGPSPREAKSPFTSLESTSIFSADELPSIQHENESVGGRKTPRFLPKSASSDGYSNNCDAEKVLGHTLKNQPVCGGVKVKPPALLLPPSAPREDMKRSNIDTNPNDRSGLWLDLSRAPKRARKHLCLDLAGDGDLEPTQHLMKQRWYHGAIAKTEAEDRLRAHRPGSFLVRSSDRHHYLLSLRSSRGMAHVKISRSASGQFAIRSSTQPDVQPPPSFTSVPQLVAHFRLHPLRLPDSCGLHLLHPVPHTALL